MNAIQAIITAVVIVHTISFSELVIAKDDINQTAAQCEISQWCSGGFPAPKPPK